MKHKSSGITLIELLVAIAVLTILLSIGVPSFNNVIQNSRSTALANEIVTALNLARSEAVRRAQDVKVCASTDEATCNGAWDGTSGWIVIPDVAGATPLRVWEAPSASAVIVQAGAAGDIIFDALGELSGGATTLSTRFTGCTGDQARSININASGRINARRVSCP
ncbi:GspH/FimT family pseudopilin [Nitrincola iocasae]|uniref:Type II secretion system protein H n=1 Tax=Nitrincola iocasae TaxID=2614693 RepID=A0A5J6L9D5_9GAMM|nr:GspH/FimT family pseudopilin [Nitrincola iocasae]QEW05259.1 prepilin-type N-terminal cleavage/methylation domain-containing protein [Nitrincola iocasae]